MTAFVRVLFRLALAFTLAMAAFTAVSAQERPVDPEPVGRDTRAIERARYMINAADYQNAAAYLEMLSSSNPENVEIKNLLAYCYKNSGEHLKLLALLQSRLIVEGRTFYLLSELGQAYLQSGGPDSARPYFLEAARKFKGPRGVLEEVSLSIYKSGHYPLEVEFIDTVRNFLGDTLVLAIARGDALAAQKRFAEAAGEYLNFLEKDSLDVNEVSMKVLALMEYPESAEAVMAVLAARIKVYSRTSRLPDIYGRMLLEKGRWDEAFEFYRQRDSMENQAGGRLVQYMRECSLREKPVYTIMAGQYLLSSLPASSLLSLARIMMAEAHETLGEFEAALAEYRSIIDQFPRPSDKAEARLKMGRLYKDRLNQPEEAAEYFTAVLGSVPRSRLGQLALFEMADVHVRRRQFDSAIVLYDSLLAVPPDEELAEQAVFRLACTHLYSSHYEEAVGQFRRLIDAYPHGMFVNDAIQYAMILNETIQETREHADLFAAAEFCRHVNSTDSLEYYLTKICRVGIKTLAPISYLHLADLYRRRGQPDQAIAAVDSLAALYPDSYYYPYGLKTKADILWPDDKSKEEARKIYRTLLEQFGTYPFAAQIRDILRRETAVDQL